MNADNTDNAMTTPSPLKPTMPHQDITGQIIGAFYQVYNALGYGFSEKVYENALTLELRQRGLIVEQQKPIRVYYAHECVGEFYVDLAVEHMVLVELKAVPELKPVHEAQLLNYLKSSRFELGLLLNFGPKARVKRKVFDNSRKGSMNWVERR